MKSFKDHTLTEQAHDGIRYHVERHIPLVDCIFRVGSEAYYKFFNEARQLVKEKKVELDDYDLHILATDIGEFAMYEGQHVPLDSPMIAEAEYQGREVELNKPKAGGSKKYFVYVKNDKGNVVKVQWGDTTGLKIKLSNVGARKNFAARHNCADKKDKTKPGYWACNLPRYAKSLGLSGGGNFFW